MDVPSKKCVVRTDEIEKAIQDLDTVTGLGATGPVAAIALVSGAGGASILANTTLLAVSLWSGVLEVPAGVSLRESYKALSICERDLFWRHALRSWSRSAAVVGIVVGVVSGGLLGAAIVVAGVVLLGVSSD